jgi:hypothetical protein
MVDKTKIKSGVVGIDELTDSSKKFSTTRFIASNFDEAILKESGFSGYSDFNKYLKKFGIDAKDRSQNNMNNATKALNQKRAQLGLQPYQNVGKFRAISELENLASQAEGFEGAYAEKGSRNFKNKFQQTIFKIQDAADNKYGVKKTKTKLKWMAQTLKSLYPSLTIGTIMTTLSKTGLGKAATLLAAQATPAAPFIDVALGAPMVYDVGKKINEQIIQPEIIEPAAKKMVEGENLLNQFFKKKMNLGGMMNINKMTRPLGYALGGPAGMTDKERTGYDRSTGYTENLNDLMRDIGSDVMGGIKSLFQKDDNQSDSLMIKRNQIIKELNNRVSNQDIDPYKAAEIINSITGSRPLDSDLINQLFSQLVAE